MSIFLGSVTKAALAASETTVKDLPEPDEAAKVRETTQKTGEPFLPTLYQPKAEQPFDLGWGKYIEHPALAEMLADPAKAVISKDVAKDLAILLGTRDDPLPATPIGVGDEQLAMNNISFKQALGIASPEDFAEKARLQMRATALSELEPQGLLKQIGVGVLQQIPQFYGQAGAAAAGAGVGAAGFLAGPVAGLAGMGLGAKVFTAGYSVEKAIAQTYEALHDDAGLPHNISAPLAIVSGALIGGVDALSFGFLGKFIGLRKLTEMFAGRTVSKEVFVAGMKSALKDARFRELTKVLGEAALTEGSTEILQEWMEIATVHLGASDAAASGLEGTYRLPTFREGIDRSIVAGSVGAILGGTHAAAGHILVDRITSADRAIQQQAKVDRYYEASDPKKLKLQDRQAPEILHEVIDKASAEPGAVKTLSVPVEKLDALFQKAGKDEAWAQATIPAVARSMEEARATGAPVVISAADFVTYVRPLDEGMTLKQEVGLNGGMSSVEAKDIAKELAEARKVLGKVAQEAYAAGTEGPRAQVEADITAKLRGAGATPEAAQTRAQVLTAAIATLASKVGLDPWEVYKSADLGITRGTATSVNLQGDLELFQRLAKVAPQDVQVGEGKHGTVRLTYPGTPLFLDLAEDEVAGHIVLTGHLGPTGHERAAAQTYGGQGVSTALYLKALEIAKQKGLGFASDFEFAQFDVTKRMYQRLPELGVPFKKSEVGSRGAEWARDYVTPADLAAYDTAKAWEAMQVRSQAFVDALTSDEVEQALGPLAMLAQQIKDDIRGFIRFDPKKRDFFKITLTPKEDLSTFLHESGHYILELQRKYAAQSPAIAADLQVLEQWAGVKAGEEWSVPALEKFARGFETYLMEGRAPSSVLAQAFANVKAWLLHVYKTLTKLGAPLSEETRSVMDRLLATEEEIQTRRVELGLFPSATMMELMTPEQRDSYRAQYAQGAAQVQARLDTEAITALRREKTAEFKTLRENISADVASEPVYQLRAFFDGGQVEGLDPALVGKKLDLQALKDSGLSRAVFNRLEKHAVTTGGIDPEVLLPYFKYSSVSEMLGAYATAPAQETEVRRRVKDAMQAKYPEYGVRKDWVEHTALTKLHEDGAISNAIELELRVLHKHAGLAPPVSPAKVAKMAAAEQVLDTPRRDIYPLAFRNAEARALREQMRALAAKDFKGAADWTRKRIMAREMWLASESALRDADKALAYAESFTDVGKQARLGKSGPLGPTFRDAAKSLVEMLGLDHPSTEKGFGAYVDILENAEQPVVIARYLTEMAGKPWEELTYSQIQDVRDALQNIQHMASDANKVVVAQREMAMDAAAARLREELQASGQLNRLAAVRTEPLSRPRRWRVEIEKVETTLRDMAGGDVGFAHKLLFRSAEEGQFDLDARRVQRIKDMKAINEAHRPENWRRVANRKVTFVDGKEYTHEKLLAVILNLGTELNRFKLLEGQKQRGLSGWTFANVMNRLHEIFPETGPKSIWAWAQATLDYISEAKTWEEQSRVAEQITGVRPRKQEAISIPLPDGTEMKGGYYPLVRDPNAVRVDNTDVVKESLDAMQGTFNYRNIFVSHGFTNERTGAIYPLLLDTNVLTAHLYEVDHFIANAMGVIERYRILRDPEIKDLIQNSVGRERYQNLIGWNAHIAREGEMNTAGKLQLDGAVNRLLWGNAIVTMGGNLLSGINQVVTGLPATVTQLGPGGLGAFSRALIEFTLHPFEMWEEASKASGELRAATFYYDRDLRLIVESGMKGATLQEWRSRIANITMTPVVFFQKMVNVVTFRAALAIAEKKGLSFKDAVAYANSEVRQSQSSAGPKDMTAVQRSHNSLARILTALSSYTFSLNDMVMPRSLTAKQLAGATARVFMLTMTGMMAKAMMDLLFPKLEEEDKKRRKGFAKKLEKMDDTGIALRTFEAWVDGPVANIPLVGRTTASLAFGREPRFGTSGAEHILKAIQGGAEIAAGKKVTKVAVKEAVDVLGIATGTPTRHLLFAPSEFMYEFLSGNVNESPWATAQEATLVRPGQKGKK